MVLRIGVHSHMTLVKMCEDGLWHWLFCIYGGLAAGYNRRLLRDQHGNACSLRIVVLLGNVENPCANHIRHLRENLRESIGIVLFINVLNIIPLFTCRFRIANIIDIEAQRLSEVVKPV